MSKRGSSIRIRPAAAITAVLAVLLTLLAPAAAQADAVLIVQHDDANLSVTVTRDNDQISFSVTNVGSQTELLGLGAYLSTTSQMDLLWQSGPFASQFQLDVAPGATEVISAPFWPGASVTIFRNRDTTPEEVVSFDLPGDWIALRMAGTTDDVDLEVGPVVDVQSGVLTPGEAALVTVQQMPAIGPVTAWISSDSSIDISGDNVVQTPGSTARMIGVDYAGGSPVTRFVAQLPADLEPGDYQIFFEGPDGRIVHFDAHPIQVLAGTASASTAGTVAITGRPRLHDTLTAVTTGWDPAATLVYQWYADGQPVLRGNQSTLVLDYYENDKHLTVEVSAYRPGYDRAAATSAATAAVQHAFFTDSPAPTITGSFVVGQKLTVVAPVWTPTTGFTYEWFVDYQPTGVTTKTYTIRPEDLGKPIAVIAKSTKLGYHDTATFSEWSAPVTAGTLTPPARIDLPKIAGVPRVGTTLDLRLGTWKPSPSFAIQWTIDGAPVPGATGMSFLVPGTFGGLPTLGRLITASIVVSSPGYLNASVTAVASAVITEGAFQPKGTVSIVGTPVVGQTLTADPGVWDPAAQLSYQWEIVNVGVVSTNPTYVIPAAAQNKKVRLTVTASAPGYVTVVRTVTTAKVP